MIKHPNTFEEELIAFSRQAGRMQSDEFRDMMLENLTFDNDELKLIVSSLDQTISDMGKYLSDPYQPTAEGLDMFDRFYKLRCKLNDYIAEHGG